MQPKGNYPLKSTFFFSYRNEVAAAGNMILFCPGQVALDGFDRAELHLYISIHKVFEGRDHKLVSLYSVELCCVCRPQNLAPRKTYGKSNLPLEYQTVYKRSCNMLTLTAERGSGENAS